MIYDSENDFLSLDCTAYSHLYYVGYGQPGNPDFIFHHTSTKMPSMLFSDYWTTACLSWRHKRVGVLYQFCIHHLVLQTHLIR